MNNITPPPLFDNKPDWASGLTVIPHRGGNDLNPYYWVNQFTYQRVTSKYTKHQFNWHNLCRDELVLLEGKWSNPAPETISEYCDPRWYLCDDDMGNKYYQECEELAHATQLEF